MFKLIVKVVLILSMSMDTAKAQKMYGLIKSGVGVLTRSVFDGDSDKFDSKGWVSFPAEPVRMGWTNLTSDRKPIANIRDSQGFTVDIAFEIKYKLVKKEVGNLYKSYMKEYEKAFAKKIETGIRYAIATASVYDLIKQSEEVVEKVRAEIEKQLSPYATCESFKFGNLSGSVYERVIESVRKTEEMKLIGRQKKMQVKMKQEA